MTKKSMERELEDKFKENYEELLNEETRCTLCTFYLLKKYRLFRYYIHTEDLEEYLKDREYYDNYIMNVALISEYMLASKNTNTNIITNVEKYNNIYSKIFKIRLVGSKNSIRKRLMQEVNENGFNTFENSVSSPILSKSFNYCRIKKNCYFKLIEMVDNTLLNSYKMTINS